MFRRLWLTLALGLLTVGWSLAPVARGAGDRAVRVFARMPPPGYPANAIVGRDGLVYAGSFKPFQGGSAGVPSRVFAFAADGHVARSYTVSGQDPRAVDAVQVATTDRSGRLYLLDQAPARVVTLDPRTGVQRTWATFSMVPGSSASPEPDFAAWGPDGSLYVTDYAQFVVWRIPPGGGRATVWLSDPALNGIIVGPAGIQLMADGHTLVLSAGAGGGTNITTGKLYTVAIRPDGSPGPLRQLWESAPLDAPDGLAVARSGNVYVALVGPTANAIVAVSPAGRTLARMPASALAPQPSPIPFDSPGSITFLGDEIIVGNQAAISQNASHMALLAVNVGEPGLPVSLPPGAAAPPKLALSVSPTRAVSGRRTVLRFTVRAGGRPLAGAEIVFRGLDVRTGTDGRARLAARFTSPGRRTFVARAPGYRPASARLIVVPAPRRP